MRPAETRRLAAIMFTDIVGFSRQMGADEARMLRLLEVHNQIVQQAVSIHHGHVIKNVARSPAPNTTTTTETRLTRA